MKRKLKKSSIWTKKNDALLTEYYLIYKKPMQLRTKFLKEIRPLINAKNKIKKELSKIASDQGRYDRAKKLGLI